MEQAIEVAPVPEAFPIGASFPVSIRKRATVRVHWESLEFGSELTFLMN